MTIRPIALAAAASWLAVAPVMAVPALDAFGHLPSVDLIAISPDGSRTAMAVADEKTRAVQIRTTADMKLVNGMLTGGAKIRWLGWAGNNHLLVEVTATAQIDGLIGPKREYGQILDVNLTTKKTAHLLDADVPGVSRKLNTVAGSPMVRTIDGKPVVFIEGTSFPNNQGMPTLFRVDLETGRTREIALGSIDTAGWLVDDQGATAARVDYDQANGQWTLWTNRDGHLVKSLTETHLLDPPGLVGFGRAPGTLLLAFHGDEKPVFREIAVGGNALSEPIAAFDDGAPIYDSHAGRIIGVRRTGGLKVSYTFFAPDDAKLWDKIVRGFPGALVDFASWSEDRQKMFLRVEGKDAGAAFYMLDVASRHATWIADEYAEIGVGDVAEKRAISYTAADGTRIWAYLTLPPGREAKGLPLVVLPHGGPMARDDARFDWLSQALASRGYAVLQPEFRGSTGFGEHFLAAGYGEWGRKMQTDLSDGVKSLGDAGTIDPKRTCIMGWSYGGYAALAGVTLQSGIYHCAVSMAGPADLRALLGWEESRAGGTRNAGMRFWNRFMGVKSPSDPALDAISPAKFAGRVDVPVLLIHGVDDTVVPIAQSRAMAAALKIAGKPVEMVTLKGEDHWLSRSETRMEMLRATDKFLAAHLPPDPPAAKPAG